MIIRKAAIDTLQKCKEYLTFGKGEGGMLAGPFFFGVSAENIPNVDSMQVVMNVVMNEGKKADYQTFGEADVQTFCQIFDRLSNDDISDPAELYRKGIIEYLK